MAVDITPGQQWEIDEARKRVGGSVGALNEYLGRLLTLATALIAGGFAAAGTGVIHRGVAAIAVTALMLSVAVCMWGLKPSAARMPADITLECLPTFAGFRLRGVVRKTGSAWAASVALLIALLIAVAGLACS